MEQVSLMRRVVQVNLNYQKLNSLLVKQVIVKYRRRVIPEQNLANNKIVEKKISYHLEFLSAVVIVVIARYIVLLISSNSIIQITNIDTHLDKTRSYYSSLKLEYSLQKIKNMKTFLVDKQINLQYLTQLLQNEDFEIKKYQRRNNLLNADDLPCGELLAIFRRFQSQIPSKRQKEQKNIVLQKALKKDEPYSNREGCGVIKQIDCGKYKSNDQIKVIFSETEEIDFPASMQKYAFSKREYALERYQDIVSKGILRRLIFLSISGYIGFDDSERKELIKGAFLLEFNAFFEYLVKPSSPVGLKFDDQDDALDTIAFMWQVNMTMSMRYYDFIQKLASLNPYLHKRRLELSPHILTLDITLIETQLLPLVHKLLEEDGLLSEKQIQLSLRQIMEYYEVHNERRIFYPYIQQASEQHLIKRIEERYEPLLREFDCPVCFLPFNNCHISKCGHSFCYVCITKSVAKYGNCPVCQQKITQSDIFRNFHMSEVKSIAFQDREDCKISELNRMKHISSFKAKFQQFMQTNIINSLQSQIDVKQSNAEYLELYEQLEKLKKKIQYVVNITFDQVVASFDVEI